MGICGTGMASLAGMLKRHGFHVTGSDQHTYPPMSDFLASQSIPVIEGYRPQNLNTRPDLVVVGNVITRDNPEAVELARLRLPYLSFPQTLHHYFLKGKKTIVVCGTHGKTTTSALVAWMLEQAGKDPGFMVGGIPLNFGVNYRLGRGPFFVIEGDEYDTAFFDKGPKFLHYNPWVTILTSIEFDHADIYRDLDHVIESFRRLLALISPGGLLIANGDDPTVRSEIGRAACPVETYGLSNPAHWQVRDVAYEDSLTRILIRKEGEDVRTVRTALYGRHNISNLLAVVACSDFLKIPQPTVARASMDFKGVRRRQEVVGEKQGILVLDDFAHHPTSVKETIGAVRDKHPGRRLIAVFEPRSNSSRRNVFQQQYAQSFDLAHVILIPDPPMMEKIQPDERFSSAALVGDLRQRGLEAFYFPSTDQLLEGLLKTAQEGDVILIMSNGAFDNLPRRVLEGIGTTG